MCFICVGSGGGGGDGEEDGAGLRGFLNSSSMSFRVCLSVFLCVFMCVSCGSFCCVFVRFLVW